MDEDGSNVTNLTNQPAEDWGGAWTAECGGAFPRGGAWMRMGGRGDWT